MIFRRKCLAECLCAQNLYPTETHNSTIPLLKIFFGSKIYCARIHPVINEYKFHLPHDVTHYPYLYVKQPLTATIPPLPISLPNPCYSFLLRQNHALEQTLPAARAAPCCAISTYDIHRSGFLIFSVRRSGGPALQGRNQVGSLRHP